MKHLLSIRDNILFSRSKNEKEEEVYNKYHELVFLLDKPMYSQTNSGEIIRERDIEEVRFVVSDVNFDKMLKMLEAFKDAEPEDLE